MSLILRMILGLIFVTFVCSCSEDEDSQSDSTELFDVSGTYNVQNKNTNRINILQIALSADLTSVRVRLAREGLSVPEGEVYEREGIYRWADSQFGRVLILGEFNSPFAKRDHQNMTDKDKVTLSVCSREVVSSRPSLSFVYCLEGSRKFQKDFFKADLVLHVLRNSEKIETVKTSVEAYSNTRWSSQYLGHWMGTVNVKTSESQDLNIVTGDRFDYDILTRLGTYTIQPADVNRVIEYKGERYILFPDEPALLDLERSSRPYINFSYRSERRGERRIEFNGHFRGAGRLEGNITFYRGRGKKRVTLGTYVMLKN